MSSPAPTAAKPRTLDVAAVIVSYSSAALTIAALISIAANSSAAHLRVRVVVVDNSGADTAAIQVAIEERGWSSWVTLVTAPRNGGFAYGNNLGIWTAYQVKTPDYIYLLNPDTEVRQGAIEELVKFLEGHPEAGIAGSSFENLDGSDWPIAFRFPGLLSELETGLQVGIITCLLSRWVVARSMGKTSQPVDWICGASMMIKWSVLEAIGGLDENYFLYFEETDFCRRARAAGFVTWYVPQSRVMHIAGQSTKVTDLRGGLKRLPAYWFESRRRYFAMAYGVSHAFIIDFVALTSHSLGVVKRLLLRRNDEITPHFVRDLARGSILRPRNRTVPAARCFRPSPPREAP